MAVKMERDFKKFCFFASGVTWSDKQLVLSWHLLFRLHIQVAVG